MAQIEVEVRGELDDFDKALEFFKKKAKFIEEKDRFSFFHFGYIRSYNIYFLI